MMAGDILIRHAEVLANQASEALGNIGRQIPKTNLARLDINIS